MTTFGFELEVSAGAHNALAHLRDLGLTQHTHYHAYHCGCTECRPSESGPLFKAQEDCTADGEIITRILQYGSADADRAMVGLSRALLLSGARTSGRVGNHVHVGREGMTQGAQRRLMRLFARYERELSEIAAGPHDAMRNYNGNISVDPSLWDVEAGVGNRGSRYIMGGHTIAWKEHTVEFRLWNSTASAWRLRTHVGLSVAMVHAANSRLVDCTRNDPRCLEDVIGDFIDSPTWAGVLRQRFSKGGVQVAL